VKRYVLSAEAETDLQEIRDYYELHAGARVARHLLQQITKGFELLADHPGIGHWRTEFTDQPVKFWQVFSYLIVYDPVTQPLGIARVLHTSRDIEALLRGNLPRP
jgi:plasmid stabilization system protein ParE